VLLKQKQENKKVTYLFFCRATNFFETKYYDGFSGKGMLLISCLQE